MVEKRSESVIPEDAAGGSAAALRNETWLESGAFQRAVLASANLAVMATDANGIIQLFNVGSERLLGYFAAEVVNRISVVQIHDPQELMVRARALSRELSTTIAVDFEALTCKASLGVEDCYESTLIRKNRERLPVAIAITVVRGDMGCIAGYSLILTDISVRRHFGLEQVKSSKSDLLTRMSHEMRTPLGAILGFAQLMDSGRPPPTHSQKKSIGRILQAGWYLEKLITLTRDLALIESGSLSLSLQPVPLAAVMLECQAAVESQAQIRGVRVTFPSLDTPCFVSADQSRLAEALSHLLSGAIEYSEARGAIGVDCQTRSAEWIRIYIHDGAGSSVGRLTRSFQALDDPGQRAHAAGGTEIGLVLAQRLIELMGGAIGVESDDVTSKVFFDLKRTPVPVAAVGTSTHSAVGEATIPSVGRPPGAVHSPDNHPQQPR